MNDDMEMSEKGRPQSSNSRNAWSDDDLIHGPGEMMWISVLQELLLRPLLMLFHPLWNQNPWPYKSKFLPMYVLPVLRTSPLDVGLDSRESYEVREFDFLQELLCFGSLAVELDNQADPVSDQKESYSSVNTEIYKHIHQDGIRIDRSSAAPNHMLNLYHKILAVIIRRNFI